MSWTIRTTTYHNNTHSIAGLKQYRGRPKYEGGPITSKKLAIEDMLRKITIS